MIALSAGHYPEAPGACHLDVCEHGEAVTWVGAIYSQLQRYEVPARIITPGRLGAKVREINDIHRDTPITLAVEVHFNSATYSGRGSETLYCPGSAKGEMAANLIQGILGHTFPPSRGVHEGWYRMDKPGVKEWPGDVEGDEKVDYFLRTTHCTALIIEPEFIQRYHIIRAKQHHACLLLAQGLRDYWLQFT